MSYTEYCKINTFREALIFFDFMSQLNFGFKCILL